MVASLVVGEQLFVRVVTENKKQTKNSPTQWHAQTTLPLLLLGYFWYCYYLCHSFGDTVLSADVTGGTFFLIF